MEADRGDPIIEEEEMKADIPQTEDNETGGDG